MYTVNSATSLAETPALVQGSKAEIKPSASSCVAKKLRNDLTRRPRAISLRWQFGDPRLGAKCGSTTNNARRFAKNTKPKIGKTRNEKESHTRASSEKNFFVKITENVRFHVRQAMLGEIASFLTEACLTSALNRTRSSLCRNRKRIT